jgi:hypothetical protein
MMQTSCPVDTNICTLVVEFDGCINRSSAGNLTELKKSREERTVALSDIMLKDYVIIVQIFSIVEV